MGVTLDLTLVQWDGCECRERERERVCIGVGSFGSPVLAYDPSRHWKKSVANNKEKETQFVCIVFWFSFSSIKYISLCTISFHLFTSMYTYLFLCPHQAPSIHRDTIICSRVMRRSGSRHKVCFRRRLSHPEIPAGTCNFLRRTSATDWNGHLPATTE